MIANGWLHGMKTTEMVALASLWPNAKTKTPPTNSRKLTGPNAIIGEQYQRKERKINEKYCLQKRKQVIL